MELLKGSDSPNSSMHGHRHLVSLNEDEDDGLRAVAVSFTKSQLSESRAGMAAEIHEPNSPTGADAGDGLNVPLISESR